MEILLNWLWQGVAVALALSLILRGLSRVPAKTKYLVCWLAKLAVVTLPLWTSAMTSARVGFPVATNAPVLSVPDEWWMSSGLLMIGWAAWASVATAQMIQALIAIAGLRRNAGALPQSLESQLGYWLRVREVGRRASLAVSHQLTAAATLAGRPPMIAIAPSLLSHLAAEDLDRVLVHEWAHVQRRDDLSRVVESLLRIVVGWHPAIWWIDRRLHVEREVACDDIVVAVTGSPKQYATCLVTLANQRAAAPTLAALAIVRTSDLRERVVRLSGRPRTLAPTAARRLIAAASVTLVAATALLSQLTLVDAEAMILPPHAVIGWGMSSLVVPVVPLAESREVAASRLRRSTVSVSQTTGPAPVAPTSGEPGKRPSPAPTDSDAIAQSTALPADRSDSVTAVSPVPSPQPQVPPQPPAVAGDTSGPPWAAVADHGVELGKASKAAGIRTANAFTRFGKRIAGAF